MSAPILLCDGFDVRRIVIGKLNGDESSTVTTEEDDGAVFSGDSLLGDAAEEEEWSEENHFCFYFVKQYAYDDPEIKAKIDEADNEIYHCNTERIHIANRLKSKRVQRLSLVASMEKLISSLDEYNAIFPHQLMNMEINEVKGHEEVMITGEIYSLRERLREIKMEIELLDVQMACVLDQRDRAFERIKNLRIQRDKGNAGSFQSRVVIKKAIDLAVSGNVRDLEEFANSEVDRFMSRWNNDKAFRDDYKKRILPSLDKRKLRPDGRIRDLEGDVDTENRNETARNKPIELKRFSTEEESDDARAFNIPMYAKLEKEEEETLKEKKREEQLEKARLAMERKKKLHEKAAAKAAIRIKKEAEKKRKELEKRAKKKTQKAAFNSSSSDVDRTTERVTEASELEKEKLGNGRSVFPKQRSFRYRHHGKENEAVLKAIIKRRKAYRLWVWTVSSAAVALPLVLLIVFFYLR